MNFVRGFCIMYFVLLCQFVHGQGAAPDDSEFSSKLSPNVGNLGVYGNIDVDCFSGKFDVSVPLFEIKERDISVPVTINYSTGGVKVATFPSWVGLNWNLVVGGVIVRNKRGEADESAGQGYIWDNESSLEPVGDISQMEKFHWHESGLFSIPYGYANPFGYSAYNNLSRSDWFSRESFLASPTLAPVIPDDKDPDEFVFQINGMSGSFFIDHTGKCKIKSKQQLDLKIEPEVKIDYIYHITPYDQGNPYLYYSFKITDGNGVVYVFGGDLSAMEFSSPDPEKLLNMPDYGQRYFVRNGVGFTELLTNPTSWFLKEIRTPLGEKIVFNYKRDSWLMYATRANGRFSNTNVGFDCNDITKFFVAPTYLQSIRSSSYSVDFTISDSKDLSLKFLNEDNTLSTEQPDAGFIKRSKLDNISIKYFSKEVKRIDLKYTENATERLKLDAIVFKGVNAPDQFYNFTYNPTKLPDYMSSQTDHWGYYNKKNPPLIPMPGVPNQSIMDSWYAAKESDIRYLLAESLTSIQYPTRGRTSFFYSSNTFLKTVTQYPFGWRIEQSLKFGGGARIKKIINDPVIGKSNIREFFYVDNFLTGDTLSSGIASGQFIYKESLVGAPELFFQNENTANMSATNGLDVIYSTVVEKNSEGFKIYKFRNHDNGYIDRSALNRNTYQVSQGHSNPNEPFISMELERGDLLTEEFYGSDKVIRFKREKKYNDDPARYDDNVRAIGRKGGGIIPAANSLLAAYLHYTFFPFVKQVIETTYDKGMPLTVVKNFEYDSHRNITRITTSNSLNEVEFLKKKYVYNYIDPNTVQSTVSPVSNPYSALIFANILNAPIEEINGKTLQGTDLVSHSKITSFKGITIKDMDGSNRVVVLPDAQLELETNSPVSYSSSNVAVVGSVEKLNTDQRMKQTSKSDSYDLKGNVTQATDRVSGSNCFFWNHNGLFLVGKVRNATSNDVAYTSFEGDNSGNWTFSGQPTSGVGCISGLSSYDLLAGQISKVGLSSSKKYIVSYWTKNNAPFSISGSESVSLDYVNSGGWRYYVHVIKGVTQVVVAGSGIPGIPILIDELRLYPFDAAMTTYSYDPAVGMISSCDENAYPTYYEYDGMNRLRTVKDSNGNIVKQIEYNYQTN